MENEKAADQKQHKRSFRKRLFRFFLYSGIVLLLLFILGIMLFRMFFPPDKIRQIANEFVQSNIHRQLSIEQVSVNPWRGFSISGIRLFKHPDSTGDADEFPVDSASAIKIVLKYRLTDLFHKNLHINQIEIVSPRLDISVRPVTSDRSAKRASPPNPLSVLDSLQLQLPVSFSLDQLQLKDARFSFISSDSLDERRIALDNLSVTINELKIPKGKLWNKNAKLSGGIALTCKNSKFSYSQILQKKKVLSFSGNLDLSMAAEVKGLGISDLQTDLRIQDIFLDGTGVDRLPLKSFPWILELALGAQADFYDKVIQINPVRINVDGQPWLEMAATVTNLASTPVLDLSLIRSRIELDQLVRMAKQVLPDSLIPPLYLHNPAAALVMDKLNAKGPLPLDGQAEPGPLLFQAGIAVTDFGATVNFGQMELASLSLSAALNGRINRQGLQSLTATLAASYDSLYFRPRDTLEVYTGPLKMELLSQIGPDLMPTDLQGQLSIRNAFGASVLSDFNLSGSSFSTLRGRGSFSLKDIYTGRLPGLPVSTRCTAAVEFSVNHLDSIGVRLAADTDSLRFLGPAGTLVFPPIKFTSALSARTDSTLTSITLSRGSIQLNQLLKASLNANIRPREKRGTVKIDSLTLEHQRALGWIPKQYRDLFKDLVFTGRSVLTGEAEFSLADRLPAYNAVVNLESSAGEIEFPPLFVSIADLLLGLRVQANSDSGVTGIVSLHIDSTRIETLRPDPILATDVSFGFRSRDFQSAVVENGRLALPTFAVAGTFQGRIDSFMTTPRLSAQANIEQNAEQPVTISRDLQLSGATTVKVFVNMDTRLLEAQVGLKTEQLSLYLPAGTVVRDINSNIKIHQKVDLTTGALVSRSAPVFNTPSASTVDYRLFRPYYAGALSEISTLTVASLEAAQYSIENIRMEAVIGDGLVEVPTLSARLYGGNMASRLSVDLAGGDMDRVSYRLSSHFSGINSALLLPDQGDGGGKGIINANLNLFGSGGNPNGKIDLGGYFYITQIGPRVADNLLRSLDPEGVDSGIKMTRWFINQGFKPRLLTFMIRNNYFYPAVEFHQPFYFPIRLSGGRVELSRMPAKFFIQTALKNAQRQRAPK